LFGGVEESLSRIYSLVSDKHNELNNVLIFKATLKYEPLSKKTLKYEPLEKN